MESLCPDYGVAMETAISQEVFMVKGLLEADFRVKLLARETSEWFNNCAIVIFAKAF